MQTLLDSLVASPKTLKWFDPTLPFFPEFRRSWRIFQHRGMTSLDGYCKTPTPRLSLAFSNGMASSHDAFLPTRDLCNLKHLDLTSAACLEQIDINLAKLSKLLQVTNVHVHHAIPIACDHIQNGLELVPSETPTNPPDQFEQRYVTVWLTRLISDLASFYANDPHQQQWLDQAASNASQLLASCAGKMAVGSQTKQHCFDVPELKNLTVRLRDASLVHDSLGTHTWGAAPVLCQLILPFASGHALPSKLLELGAGTGLVGLAIAQWIHHQHSNHTLDIYSTDYHPTVMQNLAHNALENGWSADASRLQSSVRFFVCHMDWQDVYRLQNHPSTAEYITTAQTVPKLAHQQQSVPDGLDGQFDMLLAADCIYDPIHPFWIRAVAQRYLCGPNTQSSCQPCLHLIIPLRPTHEKELEAVYHAFSLQSAVDQAGSHGASLGILKQADFVGHDNFGSSAVTDSKPIRYRWFRIGWQTKPGSCGN